MNYAHSKSFTLKVARLTCLFSLLFGSTIAQAFVFKAPGTKSTAPYSATQKIKTSAGAFSMQVRSSQNDYRVEMMHEQQRIVMLLNSTTEANYLLLPGQKSYMALNQGRIGQMLGAAPVLDPPIALGEEIVLGHKATRFQTTYSDLKGATGEGSYWVTADGIVIKADMRLLDAKGPEQQFLLELHDLQIGPQEESFFTIPETYQALGFSNIQRGGGEPVASQQADYYNYSEHQGKGPGADSQFSDNAETNNGGFIGLLMDDVKSVAGEETRTTVAEETRRKVRGALGKLFRRQE